MARMLVIEGDLVEGAAIENVIEAEAGFAIEGKTLVAAEGHAGAAIGHVWSGAGFDPPTPPSPPVPEEVPMWKARVQMIEAGIFDAVDAAIWAMTGTEGKKAQQTWEYAQNVRRDSPLIAQLKPMVAELLSVTVEEADGVIDQLFREAAALQ